MAKGTGIRSDDNMAKKIELSKLRHVATGRYNDNIALLSSDKCGNGRSQRIGGNI